MGVLVLESAIKGVFLSGGDLTEIMKHPKAAWQTMKNMREVAELMSKLPCLSIVILAGKAVGGGAELALACDERWIASDDAALELRQRDWGLPAGWNGLQNLLRIRPAGGIRRARLDFVMGRKWSVEDLLSDGLAQQDFRIAPVTRQKALAAEQAARICACPPRLRVALLRDSHVEVQPAMSSMSSFLFEKFWLAADHLAALKKHQAALRRHRTTQDPDDVKRR